VFFIHTITSAPALFAGLAAQHLPGAAVAHIVDESLIKRALAAGGLTPALYRRLCEHVAGAEDAGADVVQVTCSSLTPAIEVAQRMVRVPVLSIDDPMAEHAVKSFKRIGVIATASSTLGPSADLVRRTAARLGRQAQVEAVLCEGAYDAFFAGDQARHDRIVREALAGLMRRVDAVLLAQVSMARIADALPPGEKPVPVLASPPFAMQRLADVVRSLGKRA